MGDHRAFFYGTYHVVETETSHVLRTIIRNFGTLKSPFFSVKLINPWQMEPQVLYRVCFGTSTPTSFQASLLNFRPALLHQHRRHRVLLHDYPAVVPQQDSSVRGTYVQGLTDGDIYRLDIFEGNEYERRRVKIKVLEVEGNEAGQGNVEGEEVEVETYIWVAGKDKLEEREWDFEEFRRERMSGWIISSDEYSGKSLPPQWIRGLQDSNVAAKRSMKRVELMGMTRREAEVSMVASQRDSRARKKRY